MPGGSDLNIVPNWHFLLAVVDKAVRDKAARAKELYDWALTARGGATPAHACRCPAALRCVLPLHPPEPLPAPILILPSSSSPLLLPLTFSTRFLALPSETDVSAMACRSSSLGSHSPRRPTPADGGHLRCDRRLFLARPSL